MLALFEGRDAAGKSGSIKAVRRNLNPRDARIVALSAALATRSKANGISSATRRSFRAPAKWCSSTAPGTTAAWSSRSWASAARRSADLFLTEAPRFERMLVREGLLLFKFWLEIGREMQLLRFHQRRHNPLKIWKISPVDLAAMSKWDDFTKARDRMIAATHTKHAPWAVVKANDKRRAHLALIRHILLNIDYAGRDEKAIGKVDRKILGFGPKAVK